MARYVVDSFTTATTATTHNLGVGDKGLIALAGSTASPNTTQASVAAVSVGFAGTTGTDVGMLFGSYFGNSSAQMSTGAAQAAPWRTLSTDGSTIVSDLSTMSPTSIARSSAGAAVAFAIIGGDEVVSSRPPAVILTTAVGSTQSINVSGFSPNCGFLVSEYLGSSGYGLSFGFACQDTASVIHQWSIDLYGRKAASANGHRSASTASAIRLHSSADTVFDGAVTSFQTSGIEFTANQTTVDLLGQVGALVLSVPRVAAGKATITTNGAGTGVTGFTVANVNGAGVPGQNVGLVILASIGSSLQTLQAHNMFSIGFASSNGNQRAVSGFVTDGGGASTRYASYFGTSHAVIFVSGSSNVHGTITAPPAVITKGAFALDTASSGFTVTFDNTAANGWDVYWAALSNVVSDIGASIQSSFNANAGPKEVGHVGGNIASSFNVDAGPKPLQGIGAAIQAAFTEALGLTPDFIPGEGVTRADARLETHLIQDISQGIGKGHEKASDRFLVVQENSSSPDLNYTLDITTEHQRLGIAEYGNAKFLRILPPSTNTVPLRLAAGRTGEGMPIGNGMCSFTIADRGGSDAYLYTTEEGSTVEGVRVLLG